MRIDFYQLSRDPIAQVVPLLARKALESGARIAIVHRDPAVRAALSDALWSVEGAFLAHGAAGEDHAARQPILLSGDGNRANDASIAIVADGEIGGMADAETVGTDGAGNFARVLLLFGPDMTEQARDLWRRLSAGAADGTSGHELHIFKQRSDGAWREGR